MKILKVLVAAGLLSAVGLTASAEAQDHRRDRDHSSRYERGHRNDNHGRYERSRGHRWDRHHKRCRTVWRHHRRVRVCR